MDIEILDINKFDPILHSCSHFTHDQILALLYVLG